MDFYKKLKATKLSSNESVTDILSEVERKLEDMQPEIHASIVDKLKVQRTLSDIKSHVDSLKNLGVAVSADQQERIQEITRKHKEISTRYNNTSDVPKSPRVFRRNTPDVIKEQVQVPQNKVALLEVEEKLKSMRQRRLDRLSVFVAEQSKLSEERSNKSKESTEIEDAIKSIQKTEADKKINFKIVEENLQSKVTEEEPETLTYTPTRSNNDFTDKPKTGKSSTLRFINKLNCTMPVGSSEEDLTADVYEKVIKVSDISQTSQDKDLYIDSNIRDIEPSLDNYNPLLSPTGKQRKAVYMYDHECQFLEKEKRASLPPLSTFGKAVPQDQTAKLKAKIHTYENTDITVKGLSKSSPSKITMTTVDKTEKENSDVRRELNHVLSLRKDLNENRTSTKSLEICDDVDKVRETSSKITTETAADTVSERFSYTAIKSQARISKREDTNKTGEASCKLIRNLDIKNTINSMPPPPSPLKSPLPVPRSTHAERVLKKMQRNWENLNEILENDSDVDGDEIGDLRKTWEEADALLKEYKARITKLDRKTKEEIDVEKLKDIESYLDDMEEGIRNFKGLKRDSAYMQLSNRLSSYFLEVSKMNFLGKGGVSDKRQVIDKIDRNIKELEGRVAKNEALLMEILDMQVRSIGTNVLCITKV